MKRLFTFIAGMTILILACNLGARPTTVPETEPTQTHAQPSAQQSLCGDGVCDAAEQADPNLCPADCSAPETEQPVDSVPTVVSEPDVEPTTSGSDDSGGPDASADAGPHNAGDTACQSVEGDGPWQRSLVEWRSKDGTFFTEHRTYQVCADVPSIASDGSGLMITAFQGFESYNDEDRWDKIGVRLSRDEGESWSDLTFIDLVSFPTGSVRPFDPTITYDVISGAWRMYFSMSLGSSTALDNTFCTHSAVSDDGITYTYEADARFCNEDRAIIDPAVGFLDGTWYFAAPRGAPQDGAFFATSPDGITLTEREPIPSDKNHNWTGNFVATGGNLRFYGAEGLFPTGNFLWWAETSYGGESWSDFTRTDVPAGKDPGIIQRSDGTFILLVPMANKEPEPTSPG